MTRASGHLPAAMEPSRSLDPRVGVSQGRGLGLAPWYLTGPRGPAAEWKGPGMAGQVQAWGCVYLRGIWWKWGGIFLESFIRGPAWGCEPGGCAHRNLSWHFNPGPAPPLPGSEIQHSPALRVPPGPPRCMVFPGSQLSPAGMDRTTDLPAPQS